MQVDSILSQSDKNFKISFIIPYFNEPTIILKECIESILRLQLTPEEREIIIVDDGSDIPPLDDLIEFQDHLVYIRYRHKGTSAARNIGMQVASGSYIQFVDADDYLIPAAYNHCIQIVKHYNGDMVRFGATDNENSDYAMDINGPVTGSDYMRTHNLKSSVWCCCFRKTVGETLSFSEELTYAEDEEFTTKLMLLTKNVFYTEAKAYFYRQRSGSLTHKTDTMSKIQRLNNSVEVIHRLSQMIPTHPSKESEALQRRVAQLSMDYLYNVIRLTHSRKHLNQALNNLKKYDLFPLPEKNYTNKYVIFRKAIKTKIGRSLLLAAIR
ncbi:glycosyltransferase [Prevotella sp. A2931]|uniref:Glycosyltransferase n=1 Tax=Prevotella illustrans TaxID=2800387 RepID=A0ABS3M2D5_9BACT|nr:MULTISPECIES: glycosyltransferase [Prevotella]MBO1362353.1 glycosyltransferase [Prevotella illustrans]PTL25129.1 glycosyl transferase family 2 [Prevotella sp. oral taxon 820]